MNNILIAANWKMNKTNSESAEFISKLLSFKKNFNCEVLICPAFISVAEAAEKCKKSSVKIGAQNCHFEASGAFTGEISPIMLKHAGAQWVIVGHSERRSMFCETDEIVAKKLKAVVSNGLNAVLCVGETREKRDAGQEFSCVENQIKNALKFISKEDFSHISIAYEPVWAIGSGKPVEAEKAEKMCENIRNIIKENYNLEISQNLKILYGGSVNSSNAESFLKCHNINGALLGGASLDAEEFLKIINIAEILKTAGS